VQNQDLVRVPNLDNKTEAEARRLLVSAGLRVGAVRLASSTKGKGRVCEQIPAAGVRVRRNMPVDIAISRGSEDDPGVTITRTTMKDDVLPKEKRPKEKRPTERHPRARDYQAPERGKSVIRVPLLASPLPKDFLHAPLGFTVEMVAEDLQNPRWLTVAPSGDIFVVESHLDVKQQKQPNRVTVIGKDGTRTVWATDLYLPFGIAFHQGYLYVANTNSVVRWAYTSGQRTPSTPAEVVIRDIPERGMRQHWTRNILFSSKGDRLYLTIGSKENVAVEEPIRGTIVWYPVDGTGKPGGEPTIFASGMRNPVGMALNPSTQSLWAVVNERDYLGDDLVPDFLTEVHEKDFYGWPYYYLGKNRDPRLPARPDLRHKSRMPDVLFTAHSAPLGLVFAPRTALRGAYPNHAFIALHGSQNRSVMTGYKIIRVPFDDKGNPNGSPTDFVTGWLPSAKSSTVLGRPAGLAIDNSGSLLIADDWGGRIWRIRPTTIG
jgi:glucose/arabinose dehydrogenase